MNALDERRVPVNNRLSVRVQTEGATMIKKIEAVYDGEVFRPEDPLELEPNTRVRITIETMPSQVPKTSSFLNLARSLNLDGPTDWAENIDAYLYGGKNQDGG